MYLDDIAVWCKSKTGNIVKYVICIVILIFMLTKCLQEFVAKSSLQKDISDNKQVIEQLNYEMHASQAKIDDFKWSNLSNTRSVKDVGEKVVELQSTFGNFDVMADKAEVEKKIDDTKAELQNYIGDMHYDDWFNCKTLRYKWECMTNQIYMINKETSLPALFCCYTYNDSVNPISIVTADFDLASEKLININIYKTCHAIVAEQDLYKDKDKIASVFSNEPIFVARNTFNILRGVDSITDDFYGEDTDTDEDISKKLSGEDIIISDDESDEESDEENTDEENTDENSENEQKDKQEDQHENVEGGQGDVSTDDTNNMNDDILSSVLGN